MNQPPPGQATQCNGSGLYPEVEDPGTSHHNACHGFLEAPVRQFDAHILEALRARHTGGRGREIATIDDERSVCGRNQQCAQTALESDEISQVWWMGYEKSIHPNRTERVAKQGQPAGVR